MSDELNYTIKVSLFVFLALIVWFLIQIPLNEWLPFSSILPDFLTQEPLLLLLPTIIQIIGLILILGFIVTYLIKLIGGVTR